MDSGVIFADPSKLEFPVYNGATLFQYGSCDFVRMAFIIYTRTHAYVYTCRIEKTAVLHEETSQKHKLEYFDSRLRFLKSRF